ncbi:hypothetical protein [Leptospira saintgironsiae]|uniref:Uncharacterized protein n=1 Tax=Leptospira saintgironsiae TaxID=2023183 RepID=A0A2M9Y995_9LEPT|nr:hypothetical protein [Leptospira saintgironsiae]PJZ48006.1 hypothetical protein CH362_15905 [Leptospira saintgironsiae]
MSDVFIKKYWEEEDVTYYLHFRNGEAIRQIEVSPASIVFTSLDYPVKGDHMLYDKSLDDLELDHQDFITEDEFNEVWNSIQA